MTTPRTMEPQKELHGENKEMARLLHSFPTSRGGCRGETNWYGAVLDGEGVKVAVTPEREACAVFVRQCTAAELDDFLTLDAYNLIVIHHPREASRL